MKALSVFSRAAALLLVLGSQVGFVNGKESIGDRARNFHQKRANLANARAAQPEARDDPETKWRYLNDKSEGEFMPSIEQPWNCCSVVNCLLGLC